VDRRPVAHVVQELGVSRQTGYKWRARWRAEGDAGLHDRSSAAHRVPHRTPAQIEALICRLRTEHKLGPARLSPLVGLPALVDPPSLPHTDVSPYTLDEAKAFLKAVEGRRLEARWVLGISLGLRQGEVLGLYWEDIDLDAATLRVRAQLQRDPDTGALCRVQTKTARSRRTLPLPPSVHLALRRHRERQDAERLDADSWADRRLVFATRLGTPVHPRNDYRSFREIIRQAGLRTVRVHDLRHTAASLLLAQAVPARVVMEILGHSQISVTLNTYAHVAPEIARDAAQRVDGALWGDQ
jgi:integrase